MRSFISTNLLAALIFILCTAQSIHAAELNTVSSEHSNAAIVGVWEGDLSTQTGKLTLVLNVNMCEDSTLKASMDSPDQGVIDLQVDKIWLKENELNLELKAIGGKYKGLLAEDGLTIDGTWSQGGSSLPLVLKKDPTKKPKEIKERKVAVVDPAIYDSYAGRYQITPSFILTVSTRNNKLYVQATAQPELEVFPESETKFFYKAVNAQITFVKGDDGIVNKLILHQGGRNSDANKMAE